MSNKQKVSVIGVGRLGLSFALLLDSKGYDVMGCDVNEKYIESLNEKTFVSKEPHIKELLQWANMEFTDIPLVAFNHSDLIFVFVPTPSKENGSYDHKYVEQVIFKIESNKITNKTLVIGCTVMPGYCESLQERLLPLQIDVVYNPEFIAQGNIIDGLKNADIVLIGGSKFPQSLFFLYQEIMGKQPNFKILSLTGAEIAKISINCFLTLKISFANLIGEIIINSGEKNNVDEILEAIGSDSRIGNKFLGYGFPSGGVCLPRDQKALNCHAYSVRVHTKFMQAIDLENNRHSEYLREYYINENPDKDIPFVFSYLSYKPGVDILTHSYQLKLCMDLLRAGYTVAVPDEVKDMDTSEEFRDFCYNDKIIFRKNAEGYKIN